MWCVVLCYEDAGNRKSIEWIHLKEASEVMRVLMLEMKKLFNRILNFQILTKKYIFTRNSSLQLDVSLESRPQIDFQILGLKSLQILESNSSA